MFCLCTYVIFQSTLPRGERLDTNLFMGSGGGISIHAPARGATAEMYFCIWRTKFQSTLPRGERRKAPHANTGSKIFQSTLPRGERLVPNLHWYQFDNFNPRSREGSDTSQRMQFGKLLNFNPRSREGSDDFRVSM